MIAPVLLTLVLASAHPDDRPVAVALIARLGAPSFDDRVAAYKALERLGDEALPALRAAANTSDARVRVRVRALIVAIGRRGETDRFARSTLIRIDFPNRPLGEVVDALNDRHDLGLALRLGPEPRRGMMFIDRDQPKRLKELRDRAITLEAAQPLPFWEAIDRLCKAAALHYGISPRRGLGTSQGSLILMADRTGRGPVSDSGPYRVQITGVQSVYERDFALDPDFVGRKTKPPGVGDLTVLMAVLPEPGLMLHQNGEVILTESTDDRGRSLLSTPPRALDPNPANRSYQVMNDYASFQVNAILLAPDPPGTAIRRLHGKVPVVAVMRGSDPLVIALTDKGVVGKSLSTRDMTLRIDEVALDPGARVSVQFTVRVNQGELAKGARFDPCRPDFTAFDVDRLMEHLKLHDAAGRRLDYSGGPQTRGADAHGFYDRYRLTVAPVVGDGPAQGPRPSKTPIPAELRYYPFVQKATEVAFDFRDIPMP